MKKIITLLLLSLNLTTMMGQKADSLNYLFVDRGNKILQFKLNRPLNIKTTDGQGYWSKNYLLLDEGIIMFRIANPKPDTIMLQDIKWIKGRTHGNDIRIFGGAMLTLSGPVAGFFPVFATAFGGGPAGLVAIPFILMSVEGVALMLPRKFKVREKWNLSILKL